MTEHINHIEGVMQRHVEGRPWRCMENILADEQTCEFLQLAIQHELFKCWYLLHSANAADVDGEKLHSEWQPVYYKAVKRFRVITNFNWVSFPVEWMDRWKS